MVIFVQQYILSDNLSRIRKKHAFFRASIFTQIGNLPSLIQFQKLEIIIYLKLEGLCTQTVIELKSSLHLVLV